MEQFWRVINIDKRQELGDWSKLGQGLFQGPASSLVNYLAVPSSTTTPSHSWYPVLANGEWAGDRIICVGDYAEDVPEGMFDDKETQEFIQLTREVREKHGHEVSWKDSDSIIRLNAVARAYFEDPTTRTGHFDKAGFTNDEVWVLRNLTKHEYVRADAVILHSDEINGPFLARSAVGRRPD